MHEMGIAMEIRTMSRSIVAGRGPGRIEAVKVAVGELAAVEPELLQHAWAALTRGGPEEGSRLEVEWRPARQRCATCGESKARAAGSWLRLCPDCGMALRVEGGDDLDLLEIDFNPIETTGGPPS